MEKDELEYIGKTHKFSFVVKAVELWLPVNKELERAEQALASLEEQKSSREEQWLSMQLSSGMSELKRTSCGGQAENGASKLKQINAQSIELEWAKISLQKQVVEMREHVQDIKRRLAEAKKRCMRTMRNMAGDERRPFLIMSVAHVHAAGLLQRWMGIRRRCRMSSEFCNHGPMDTVRDLARKYNLEVYDCNGTPLRIDSAPPAPAP